VLGSGAGGGVPQWNCACENCNLARAGDPRVAPRTQDSLAVSGRGDRWLLVNASPDIGVQLARFAPLHPRRPRDTPIAAVALTNGDLDHVVGLLSLRESQPFAVLATERVRAGLVERNAMLRTLARTADQVAWQRLHLGQELVVDDAGVGVTALAVPGKLPVHLTGIVEPSAEDNVALRVRDLTTGRTVVIATAVGSLEGTDLLFEPADALFFDGTFWTEEELITLGLGKARARDMAHLPMSGTGGSLSRLGAVAGRRIFTHINNTNPVLREDSRERASVVSAGWEVAFDGFEVSL
jgi:pyrroloquinoline quinone biosynthesis protein B